MNFEAMKHPRYTQVIRELEKYSIYDFVDLMYGMISKDEIRQLFIESFILEDIDTLVETLGLDEPTKSETDAQENNSFQKQR